MDKESKKIELSLNKEILLLGFLCVKDLDTIPEKVKVLDRFGLSNNEISLICDCASQSVRNAHLKNK